MKRLPFLSLTCLALVPHTHARDLPLDTVYGEPVVVLTVTNPWLMVIGSDVPSFALYEQGQVIYSKVVDQHRKFFEAVLTAAERDALLAQLDLPALAELPREIEAVQATDQPDNIIYARQADSAITRTVYGYLTEGEGRKHTPKAFLRAYELLLNYTNDRAVEWIPRSIELMVWDYDYAPNSRPWPADWPDLHSATTIERSNGMYSIYLPRERMDELRQYLREGKEKEAVVINERKMTVSVRFPFPNLP